MDYQIQLPVFEGPFDLLLHLIKANQVDIYDIPIAEITAQYLEYLQQMQELDLEIASSFLVMAATLLSIKARMLLPNPTAEEEEEDVRSSLVHDLLEYMQFKEAAQSMAVLRDLSSRRIARPNEQELYLNLFRAENPLDGKTLADLQSAFYKVLSRIDKPLDEIMHIERERVTLRDRLDYLYQLILQNRTGLAFSQAFASCDSRTCIIVTFLALLELIRQQVIRVNQGQQFGEIFLYAGELGNYDRNASI